MLSPIYPPLFQTLTHYSSHILDYCKTAVSRWLPKGFLPKVVVWLSAESLGALAFDKLSHSLLSGIDDYFRANEPYYETLPLIATTGFITYYLVYQQKKISKVALIQISLAGSFFISMLSLKELNENLSKIYGTSISHLASMFANIVGGFIALKVTSCEENFDTYRFKMVEHAIAGKIYDITVINPNFFPLKIVRHVSKVIFQSFAYNRKELFKSFKLSVRRTKSYGVITPCLTRALYSRFESIDKIQVSEKIIEKITPFFNDKSKSLLTSQLAYGYVDQKIDKLKCSSEEFIHLLARTTINYSKLIQTREIKTFNNLIVNCFQVGSDEKILSNLTEKLKKALESEVENQFGRMAVTKKYLFDKFLWNEKNISFLSTTISELLNDTGTYLMGHGAYPSFHSKYVDLMLKCHIKPFLTLLFFDQETIDLMKEPISEFEDIELTLFAQKIAFDTLVHPLLPNFLSKVLRLLLRGGFSSGIQFVHKLQGFQPKTNVYSKPTIVENYVEEPKAANLPIKALQDTEDSDFEELNSFKSNGTDEDFVLLDHEDTM
jgi:hypothetical protein